MNPLHEIPISKLNSECLPTLRCYHCNKILSLYYERLYKVQEAKVLDFFKEESILRYCCKMCLFQDYLSYKNCLEQIREENKIVEKVEPVTEPTKNKKKEKDV